MHGEVNTIDKPWLVVHEKSDGSVETIIPAPHGATYEMYGLLVADVIRHVARAFRVAETDVVEWINKEMDSPTTPISGGMVRDDEQWERAGLKN
jgi:hypothetical protein